MSKLNWNCPYIFNQTKQASWNKTHVTKIEAQTVNKLLEQRKQASKQQYVQASMHQPACLAVHKLACIICCLLAWPFNRSKQASLHASACKHLQAYTCMSKQKHLQAGSCSLLHKMSLLACFCL